MQEPIFGKGCDEHFSVKKRIFSEKGGGIQAILCQGPEKRKKHIILFNIDFLAPHPKPPFWAPRKKVYVPLISWQERQKGPT